MSLTEWLLAFVLSMTLAPIFGPLTPLVALFLVSFWSQHRDG